MKKSPREQKFVVATPGRSVCDDNARVLERHGLLRFIALGTRRGTAGISPEHTRLAPWFGLFAYVAAKTLSNARAESLRLRMHPLFDRWVRRQLRPGDHIISSYGYANECFKWVRQNGGRTFLDGGNSHPDNFWTILDEEHRRWKSPWPATPRHHYRRAMEMMPYVDYVLSPSSFVTRSFLDRGFRPEQIIRNVYPLDLECFQPARTPRPPSRPLTIVSTGMPSLRKGTPYMLEAFRLVRRHHPTARLILTGPPQSSLASVLDQFRDVPIEWSPSLPHAQLAEHLRSADIFVLPSLEDGFARTVAEALACGLPVITTANTGAADLVEPGINGEIVPIRDGAAIASAILKHADNIISRGEPSERMIDPARLSFDRFEQLFLQQLTELGIITVE